MRALGPQGPPNLQPGQSALNPKPQTRFLPVGTTVIAQNGYHQTSWESLHLASALVNPISLGQLYLKTLYLLEKYSYYVDTKYPGPRSEPLGAQPAPKHPSIEYLQQVLWAAGASSRAPASLNFTCFPSAVRGLAQKGSLMFVVYLATPLPTHPAPRFPLY